MIVVLVLISVLTIALVHWLWQEIQRPPNFPPGPQWLPVIGNFLYIRKLARASGGLHVAFEAISKQYKSPVIGLKLGQEYVVVALQHQAVQEALNKDEFDGRPDNFFLRLRCMGTRLGITFTDGPFWTEHRSFVVRHLREAGYGRCAMREHIHNELQALITLILDLNGDPVWPGSILPIGVINVLWTLTTGSRIPEDDQRLPRLLQLMRDRSKAFDMSGGVLSQMPWLRHIAPDWTGYNIIKRFNQEILEFFRPTIAVHHQEYTEAKCSKDLIYAFIKEMKDRQDDPDSTFTDLQLTMIILDIFIAGSQTTSSTIDIALMVLAMNQKIQKNIYQEIHHYFGKVQEIPKDYDRARLPRTEAFLFEVMRLYQIAPIGGPRRALSDCTLAGYHVPKNATVMMGLHTIQMDPDHWHDPDIFRPERFLSSEGKLISSDRMIQFGLGKRRCLGESLARSCMLTFLVGIVHRFRVCLPENGAEPPSLKLLPGITLSPRPYRVVFEPRFTDKK